MRTLTTMLLLLITLTSFSQATLDGKWIVREIDEKAADENMKAMMIDKMGFEFKADGVLTASAMGQTITGTWVLKDEGKTLVMGPTNDQETFTVLDLQADRLEIRTKEVRLVLTRPKS